MKCDESCLIYIYSFSLGKSVQVGKGAMRLPYVKHQPVKQGQTTTPGTPCPTLYDKCVGSLTSPADYITLKMQGTGPTIYRPYPRRLEHLTICRCHCKGSMFSSVILRPWVLVRSEVRTQTFRTAVRCSANWANRSAVIIYALIFRLADQMLIRMKLPLDSWKLCLMVCV